MQGALEQISLNRAKHLVHARSKSLKSDALLVTGVAPHRQDLRLLDILGPDLNSERHPAHLPLGELPARPLVAFVEHHAHAGRLERVSNLFGAGQDGLAPVVPADRHDDDLIRSDARRQDQAAVIAVDHDDRANEPGRDAP